MSTPIRILGIGGSVRADSVNRRLLQLMLETARDMGAEVEIADVYTLQLPIFNQYLPLEEQPKKLFWLIEEMKKADGFIICTPTYLGSLSGAVKNTLDSLHLAHGEPRVYFEDRPVALASYGFYGQQNAINSLSFVTRAMGGSVVPEHLMVQTDEDKPDPGILQRDSVQQQMLRTVGQLFSMAERARSS